jgi:hypothetical protein
MAGKVYFGNKDKQQWIKAPSSGMKAGSVGYVSETQLLNGGATLRRSQASHRKFSASWNGSLNTDLTAENLHVIKDYADGIYGDGPFYWLDPFAVAENVLPPHWAAPMLTQKDWSNLAPGFTTAFVGQATTNNYPVKYASYNIAGAYQSSNKLTIIIPQDYALNFGWHGPTTGSTTGVRVVPYLRSTGLADTALNPTKLGTDTTTRTNLKIKGDTYSHVEIFIAVGSAAVVNITGMIAQVLPENSSVANGGFISGRGTTGLEFSTFPQIDLYSSAINDGWVSMSVDWVEVE